VLKGGPAEDRTRFLLMFQKFGGDVAQIPKFSLWGRKGKNGETSETAETKIKTKGFKFKAICSLRDLTVKLKLPLIVYSRVFTNERGDTATTFN
jgi:hypothetical protein